MSPMTHGRWLRKMNADYRILTPAFAHVQRQYNYPFLTPPFCIHADG
jgi:hypothetical protein